LVALLDDTRGVLVSALDGDGNPIDDDEDEEDDEDDEEDEDAAAAAAAAATGCTSLAGASS